MKAMHEAIRTGNPEHLRSAVPTQVQRYVMPPSNHQKGQDSLEGDVVPLIAEFVLKFVRNVRTRSLKIAKDMDKYIREKTRKEEKVLEIVAPDSPDHDAQDREDAADGSEDGNEDGSMDASVPAAATTQDAVARLVTGYDLNTSWGNSFLPTIGHGEG